MMDFCFNGFQEIWLSKREAKDSVNTPKGWSTMKLKSPRIVLALVSAFVLLSSALLPAQTTVGTGSISGTVTDPSGAVVDGATVAITNGATNQVINLTSNSAGGFNAGALVPGTYKVQVSVKGFSTVS